MGRKTNKQRRATQGASAREKAAAARAIQQRAEQRQRAMKIIGTVVVVAVIAVVAVVIAVNRPNKTANNASGNRVVASAAVVKDLTSVSDATYTTVDKGSASDVLKKATGDPPLTLNGKPEVLFVGAEWCPFCAAERWSLIMALSKFGTFKGLNEISSSSTDTDPNTPTFSFYKSTYTSKYLSFVPVENQARDRKPLVNMTAAQNKLFTKYTTGYPFVYYGGKYVQTGTTYDPAILAGLSQATIASNLNDPTNSVTKAIVGSANVTTATLCTLTDNQPASVCLTPTITNLQSELNA